jgi:general secretion pathway protein A
VFYRFFGLSGPPFEFGSSPNTLFMSTPHREALSALEWGVAHETSGFTLLVGETGTGKTTLVNALLAQQHERVQAAYVLNPRLRIEEIMNLVLEQLKVENVPTDRLGLWREIERKITQLEEGERIMVIVDDAQDLSDDCLEDLRLLSNCEAHGNKRLHFILVSQPELLTRLRTQKLRNINQRIGARATLNPLKPDEARSYVDYRLRQKGGSAQKIFSAAALRHLIAQSDGIPRQINLLCNSAMLAAYAEGTGVVTPAAARAAVSEYRNLHGTLRISSIRFGSLGLTMRARPWATAAVTGAGLAAAAFLYLALSDGFSGPQMQPVEATEAVGGAPEISASGERPASISAPTIATAPAPVEPESASISVAPPTVPQLAPATTVKPPSIEGAGKQSPRADDAVKPPLRADRGNNTTPPAGGGGSPAKGFGLGRGDSPEGLRNSYFGFEVAPGQVSNPGQLAGETNQPGSGWSASSTASHNATGRHHRKHQRRTTPHRNYDQAEDNATPAEPLGDDKSPAAGEAAVTRNAEEPGVN